MAKKLNGNRIFWSKFALGGALLVVFISRQYWGEESPFHEIFEIAGIILLSLCAMGRIYSTAFLGGFKNDTLITYGIYSVMRNPLYFFSLIGITGVALTSNHIVVMITLPLFFFFMYMALIKREETFLEEKFGEEFISYRKSVPAFWPDFRKYSEPEVVEMSPRFLRKAFFDAIWWLTALPVIELVELLQDKHFLPVLFVS